MTIPLDAKEVARKAFRETHFMDDALMNALEAAAPYILRNTATALTAESPRLPNEVRNQLFALLGDFMDKFELESRVKGPARLGFGWGDMYGDFERRIVAVLRASR